MKKFAKPLNLRTLLVSGGIIGAMGVYCAPAYAQIDEIVVTARKTEENLQDVPIAVTAFTAEFFQDSGLVELSDIGKLTPNFDIQEDGVSGSGFSNVTLRGQTALNRELSSDQAVGITINGAPITRGTNLFSNLFDVEQIEVLKGPQGTLFGKNTTGGAVVITTTAPKLNEFSGYAEVDIGNFDRNDFEGVFNVGGETWALRFGAASQSRDGFNPGVTNTGATENLSDGVTPGPSSTSSADPFANQAFTDPGSLSGVDFADDDELFYRASALFVPNDQLSIRLNADYHEVNEIGQGTRVVNPGILDLNLVVPNLVSVPGVAFTNVAIPTSTDLFGPNAVADIGLFDLEPSTEADETNLNATVEYDFGLVNFTSITSYRDQSLLAENPFAGNARVQVGQESDIFAQELRFAGDAFNDRLKWQFGGFFANEEGIDIDNVGAPTTVRITEADNETIAVFGQGTFEITDQLSFTGGLRYTEEDRGLALIEATASDVVPEQEVSFNGTSWLAALDYKVTDDILTYASISRGFKSGGIDDESLALLLEPQSVGGVLTDITVDDITIEPEFVINYEIGFKADLFNNTLRWNSAAFYSDYTNIQVQTFDPLLTDADGQAIISLSNGAEAEIYGFESELTYSPNDQLTLGGTIGYTKAEFQEFLDVNIALDTVTDRSDEEIGGPEWQASAFARYEDDISDNIRAGIQLNYSYRGREEILAGAQLEAFDDPSQGTLDSFGIFNGQIDFDIEQIDTNIAFYGRNLFDNEHDTTGFALVAFGLPLTQRAPGAPRTYGVRVRKTF